MTFEKLVPNLMVEDVSLTLNYYHGVLGFETISTWPTTGEDPTRATVKKDDVEITFQAEDSLKKEIPELRHDDPAGGFTLTIMISNVQEFYDHLYSSLDVVVHISENSRGMRQFTVKDINGYYLTFAERI